MLDRGVFQTSLKIFVIAIIRETSWCFIFKFRICNSLG